MTPLGLRRVIDRGRAMRATFTALALVLGFATAAHHSGLMDDAMMPMGGDHPVVAGMCVGIAVAPVAIVGMALVPRPRRRTSPTRRRRSNRLLPPAASFPTGLASAARDGPRVHLRLCVDRR